MGVTGATVGLLPPTINHVLLSQGDAALYNEELLTISIGLFLHCTIFGLVLIVCSFDPARVLNLHLLTTLLALTLIIAPLVFLIDPHVNYYMLNFFLEHESLEILIAIRVFRPRLCRNHPGYVLSGCFGALTCITTLLALNNKLRNHATDMVSWGAFISDGAVALAGCRLAYLWVKERKATHHVQKRMEVMRVQGLAGLGCIAHGVPTMAISPIFTVILHTKSTAPSWFAWSWVVVFVSVGLTISLFVPGARMYTSTLEWCCWHRRKVLFGQANFDWGEVSDESQEVSEEEYESSTRRADPKGPHFKEV